MQTKDLRHMTPEPEELVRRLIDHLEAQMRSADSDAIGSGSAGDGMTARILPFVRDVRSRRLKARTPGDVLDFGSAREARAEARTVSGIFVYTARL